MIVDINEKYVTVSGAEVVLLSDKGPDKDYPFIGYLKPGASMILSWNKEGVLDPLMTSREFRKEFQLVLAPKKVTHTFWMNVYKNGVRGPYTSKECADQVRASDRIGEAQEMTITVKVPE